MTSAGHSPRQFTVVQLGHLNRVEADNALGLANLVQRDFRFELLGSTPTIDVTRTVLPNGTYDLDLALSEWVSDHRTSLPVIGISADAYGDRHSTGPRDRYFMNFSVGGDSSVSLISTCLWSELGGRRPLQPYLLYSLAGIVFCQWSDVFVHAETRACVLGYCSEPRDIDDCIAAGCLCPDCERAVGIALKQGRTNNSWMASARRLLNRATGRRSAFVVTPFRREFAPVRKAVAETLGDLGWTVVSGDRIATPRRITDAIVQAIFSADLVVADITGDNANVFYELGLAHASAADVLMLTQSPRIPFDVTTERAIRYTTSSRGLIQLREDIRQMVGTGPPAVSNQRTPAT